VLHGLEGSSISQYMIGVGNKAWAAGMNVVRMNMRNCGGTEDSSSTLYHSGLSGDVDAVIKYFIAERGLKKIVCAGYSMGGNIMMKLAANTAAMTLLLSKSQPLPQFRRRSTSDHHAMRYIYLRTASTNCASFGISSGACGERRNSFPASSISAG